MKSIDSTNVDCLICSLTASSLLTEFANFHTSKIEDEIVYIEDHFANFRAQYLFRKTSLYTSRISNDLLFKILRQGESLEDSKPAPLFTV